MKCVYHAQLRDSLRLPRQISGRLSQDKPVPDLFLLFYFSCVCFPIFSWPLICIRLIVHVVVYSVPIPPERPCASALSPCPRLDVDVV